jgi:hypothetical protein
MTFDEASADFERAWKTLAPLSPSFRTAEHTAPEWQTAMEVLILVATFGGPASCEWSAVPLLREQP